MHRTVSRLAVPVVAALAVGACGSSGGSAPASSGASSSTPAASSASSASSSATPSGGATMDPATFTQRSAAATKAMKTYHMVLDGEAMGAAMKGQGDVDTSGSSPRMALTMNIGPQKVDLRLVDGVAYTAIPGRTPAGKFVKLTDAQMREQGLGSLTDQLSLQKAQDQNAKSLKKVVDEGTDTVDGVTTHKYLLTIDGAAAKEQTRKQLVDRKVAQADIDKVLARMPAEITTTTWVDDQFRTRRTQADVAGARITTTISKIDEPVSITVPTGDQVVAG